MKPGIIHSLSELSQITASNDRTFLLLYKSNSATSGCADSYLEEASAKIDNAVILKADVVEVRDIHPAYGVDTVPSLLIFEKSALKNIVKGCQTASYYKDLIENQLYQASSTTSTGPSVTVYSTPTCSWCTTLKNYLRQHKVYFTDVDVSANPEIARDLVNRTGQTGVPQTEINGEMVVGFDKAKINRLLNING
ncbi:MAG: thioredoxin family protein [Bacteroidales bacterium]|jgi:glutaredoxin-like YruB-family protein|nr:thioredoxin family protein [Bacteroidales bacterium]